MSQFARADDALDDVLAESGASAEATADPTESKAPVDEAVTATDADEAVGSGLEFPAATESEVAEADWLCSEDEARAMVDRAREAITELDSSLRQIIERRAWEPLGYADPKEFVLAELGPSAVGGKSKAQAYRLARLAMFLYGLAEAFGDESPLLDITERSMRAIPPGVDGENDAVLTERVTARLGSLDEVTEESAQAAWDEEYARAREEIATTGRLSRSDEDSGWADTDDDQWDEVPDAGEYQPDTFSLSDISGSGEESESGDEEQSEWETQSTSRSDFIDAHGVGEKASEATLTYVEALRELMSGLAVVVEASKHLPDIVEYATDEEIEKAREMAEATEAMTKALIEAADERDDSIAI